MAKVKVAPKKKSPAKRSATPKKASAAARPRPAPATPRPATPPAPRRPAAPTPPPPAPTPRPATPATPPPVTTPPAPRPATPPAPRRPAAPTPPAPTPRPATATTPPPAPHPAVPTPTTRPATATTPPPTAENRQRLIALAAIAVSAVIGIWAHLRVPDLQPVVNRLDSAERNIVTLSQNDSILSGRFDGHETRITELEARASNLENTDAVLTRNVAALVGQVANATTMAKNTARQVAQVGRNATRTLGVALGDQAVAETVWNSAARAKTTDEADSMFVRASRAGLAATTAASVNTLTGRVISLASEVNAVRAIATAAKVVADSAATRTELRQVARTTAAAFGKVANANGSIRKTTKAERGAAIDSLALFH